jgi:hypothetical protein
LIRSVLSVIFPKVSIKLCFFWLLRFYCWDNAFSFCLNKLILCLFPHSQIGIFFKRWYTNTIFFLRHRVSVRHVFCQSWKYKCCQIYIFLSWLTFLWLLIREPQGTNSNNWNTAVRDQILFLQLPILVNNKP